MEGQNSSAALTDVRSYLAARLPATYAACAHVLADMAALLPQFKPVSLLDLGAGPGTASWAAAEAWPAIKRITLLDCHPGLAAVARELCQSSAALALQSADQVHADFATDSLPGTAELVIAAYAMAELPLAGLEAVIRKAWAAADQALVIVEPGTPAGFARVRLARQCLAALGATILAPCPHQQPCPLREPDWCHFAVRLPRSRLHMQAKQATVPFEDEKFSYVVALKQPASPAAARVLVPPQIGKAHVSLNLCEPHGLAKRQVARRSAAAYKLAKKLAWGDALTQAEREKLWPEN